MFMLFVFTAVGLVLFLFGLAALVWSIRSGQMDDLDTPAMRMLNDDAAPPAPTTSKTKPFDSSHKIPSFPSEPS